MLENIHALQGKITVVYKLLSSVNVEMRYRNTCVMGECILSHLT